MARILVVDDEEGIRLLYREELAESGHDVVVAANAEEALRLLRECRPDVMTVDIKMPGMDGIELIGRVRELYRELPIVLCTAYDYRRDFGTWAGDAYLTKSADLTELKATIRELLARAVDEKSGSGL